MLKVESSSDLMQWFYDRLVCVAADMSDPADKVGYLQRHDTLAEQIGGRGRELAEAMTCE